ncbi:DUF1315 family protein [Halieaceae bacterium IMCC14734]|uniref:DUF1315 family protein n=1 Tax=Candidatus Litorirhabdus singularis TaxID=2518993 RepID=A0ABT3THE1_9GAMM|nr:DUF1315 family protein [Candidatus Litorirhabdus singularis]MCX2981696.1 DUF1315 family protein [Candidatus Litorirhabdus singularis]
MNYQEMVANLTPDLVARFKTAVELGRWPDGRSVTPQQREDCMAAIIAYESLHVSAQERTGYIDKGAKARASRAAPETQPLKFEDEPSGEQQ